MISGLKAIAGVLGVSPLRVKGLIFRHSLPVAFVGDGEGRRYMASVGELMAWVDANKLRQP